MAGCCNSGKVCGVIKSLIPALTFAAISVVLIALIFQPNLYYVIAIFALLSGLTFYVITSAEWFDIARNTIKRDLTTAYRFARFNIQVWNFQRQNKTINTIFDEHASKHPNSLCFMIDDTRWSYEQVRSYSYQIADFFQKQGFKKGDVVALYMKTQVEYVSLWLGLARIGVVTAWVNTNLRNKPLEHSINIVNAKAVIYCMEMKEYVEEVKPKLDPNCGFYCLSDDGANFEQKSNVIFDRNTDTVKNVVNLTVKSNDTLSFIYTSGTTGLPKAAIITHTKFFIIAQGIATVSNFNHFDRVYDPLPIYHTAGGVLGVGQALINGIPVVLRSKFSATSYWTDCAKYECSIGQYIGEMCRYILATPESDIDKLHRVRLMVGNGLRPQIWTKFQSRFGIKEIIEFYGATEGNCSLVNVTSHPGAVGFLPPLAAWVYPVTLIRCDQSTGDVFRNERGYCERSKPGEDGLLIGKITNRAYRSFEGYADKGESSKKILHDVFSTGDEYFNTGDVLVRDKYGYLYFKDRTGDTFRWKGENVATSEVEAIVSNLIDLNDAIVYGVSVPNTEGKAGMMAIVDPNKSVDLNNLLITLKSQLPSYAVPIFARVMKEVPKTGTYKLQKAQLQKDGFNIRNVLDSVFYVLNGDKYELLTEGLYESILNGSLKL